MLLFEASVDFIVGLIGGFGSKEVAFGAAFSILGVSFALWVVAVLRPHRRFVSAMRSAIRAVHTAMDDKAKSPEDRRTLVNDAVQDNPVLGSAWRPYWSALRPDSRRKGHVVNPVDPHAWFAVDRLPGRGYEK